MDKSGIYATRRANLRRLVRERYGGVQARLASAIGRPANYVWRLLSDGPHAKNVGDGLARVIEERAGLPSRWLDGGPPCVARDWSSGGWVDESAVLMAEHYEQTRSGGAHH